MDVVHKIESSGNSEGKPSDKIIISNCGEIGEIPEKDDA